MIDKNSFDSSTEEGSPIMKKNSASFLNSFSTAIHLDISSLLIGFFHLFAGFTEPFNAKMKAGCPFVSHRVLR